MTCKKDVSGFFYTPPVRSHIALPKSYFPSASDSSTSLVMKIRLRHAEA